MKALYRSEIDGLRAISILAVIFYHAGIDLFKGGFLGVDVFFVISGFLIFRSFSVDGSNIKFSIWSFYEKRARRILPAYLTLILLITPVALLILLPDDGIAYLKSLIASNLFSSNIFFWRETGYFDRAVELKPLLHTWSLGVEEQFYLIFPFFLLLQSKFSKRLSLFILILSLSLCLIFADRWPVANFYLLPTRIWEFLFGTICGSFYEKINNYTNSQSKNTLALFGFFIILLSFFIYDEGSTYPNALTIFPVFGTSLILLFGNNRSGIVNIFLNFKALTFIGLISYSLYLYHQPIFALYRYYRITQISSLEVVVLISLIFIISIISWRFIERPFRDPKKVTTSKFLKIIAFFYVATLFLSILAIWNQQLFKDLWLDTKSSLTRNTFDLMEMSKNEMNFSWNSADPMITKGYGIHGDSDCRFDVEELSPDIENVMMSCFKKFGPGISIIGDSHAVDLFGMIIAHSNEKFIVGVTKGGCRPHSPKADCQYQKFLDFVTQNPILFKKIIFEQAGFYLLNNGNKPGTREMFSEVDLNKSVKNINPNYKNISLNLDYLMKLAKYVNVIWFGPKIEPHFKDSLVLRLGCNYQFKLRDNQENVFLQLDDALNSATNNKKNLRYLSQIKMLDLRFPDDYMSCKYRYWEDGDHFSASGEIKFGSRLQLEMLVN